MWVPLSSFAFFNQFQTSAVYCVCQQPIEIPCCCAAYRSYSPASVGFLPPINPPFGDHRLFPRPSRTRENIFEEIFSRTGSRFYSAQPPTSRTNRESFEVSYKIHDGFTQREETVIENALGIVSQRFLRPEILLNMYDICGTSRCKLGPGVWEYSQLEDHDNYGGKYDLLRYQLMCLRVKGRKDEFPTINIHPYYEETSSRGRSHNVCVSCICKGSKFSIEGEFNVWLNRYQLDGLSRHGSDPVVWGGVIAHEMLHNLGHMHPKGDYSDAWQINVFKKCFIHDGNYQPRTLPVIGRLFF